MGKYLGIIALAAGAAWAQPAGPASFEVASVKRVEGPAPSGGGGGGKAAMPPKPAPPGNINYPNITLKELVRRAYGLTEHQIAGPEWIATERYNVLAKLPEGANQGDIPRMLQTLLSERFHLGTHHEERVIPLYALLAPKDGGKLKQDDEKALEALTAANPDWADKIASVNNGTTMVNLRKGHMVAKMVTMPRFADFLKERLGRPVVDMTDMPGAYSFALDWVPDTVPGLPDSGTEERIGLPLAAAVQSQMGLKLETRNVPSDVLVVDRADKEPVAN